ncbi:hypothetical protein U1Q18_025774 [Sarracenia purpurea var. burkii]
MARSEEMNRGISQVRMVSSSPHVNQATNEDRVITMNPEVRVSPSRMSSDAFQVVKYGSGGASRDGGFQSKNKTMLVALSGNEVGTSDDLYANVLEGDSSKKTGSEEALVTGEGAEVDSEDPSAVIATECGTVNESEDQFAAIESDSGPRIINNAIHHKLSQQRVEAMSREITEEEIRDVMWSLPVNKAPGPNGFSAGFFRASWEIIGLVFFIKLGCCFVCSGFGCLAPRASWCFLWLV